MKKKAFEEAGIPVKQISLVQVQPQTIVPTQITQEMVYIKSEPQLMSTIPSTSTTILIPTSSEPPSQLIVSDDVKDEDIHMGTQIVTQIGTHDELNLLTNTDEVLLSSLATPSSEGTDDSIEIKMEEVTSG